MSWKKNTGKVRLHNQSICIIIRLLLTTSFIVGLLTDKGYKRKKLKLELELVEQEFANGTSDLMQLGYHLS